ncbi:MAG: beta-ribofuranosylaminobenzene 5'-phosphate synthase family protein [Candidatus Heimdallarchaeota archaeon]
MPITIITPSRLHFGLLDLNGELGRINGGLGVALENPGWEIIGYMKDEINSKVKLAKIDVNTEAAIKKFDAYFKTKTTELNFEIKKDLPVHMGLGSKTQFLLSIGSILACNHELKTTPREIAKAVQRGGTSGIGVAAFEAGGFILDSGHSFGPGKQTDSFKPSSRSKAPPPLVIFQNYPPENWRFIVIIPNIPEGASGDTEVKLFEDCCPIPAEQVEKLSRLILMKILPSFIEKDIAIFGEGLTELQTKFHRFGMEKYDSTLNNDILIELRKNKLVFGSGISSFGPTMYALTNSQDNAEKIIQQVNDTYSKNEIKFITSSKVNTTGARIKIK